MKKVFRLIFILLSGFWLSIGSLIAQIDKVRIEPPNWRVGMTCPDLQLMENTESQVSPDFSKSCGYISPETFIDIVNQSEEVGKLLNHMVNSPKSMGHETNRRNQLLSYARDLLPTAHFKQDQ